MVKVKSKTVLCHEPEGNLSKCFFLTLSYNWVLVDTLHVGHLSDLLVEMFNCKPQIIGICHF